MWQRLTALIGVALLTGATGLPSPAFADHGGGGVTPDGIDLMCPADSGQLFLRVNSRCELQAQVLGVGLVGTLVAEC